MSSNNGFRIRPFISVLMGFSFLFVCLTGVILFVTPPGRIANWTDWNIWGLDKHQWISLHICFSAVCVITTFIHTWLNRKALVSYFISKLKQASGLRIEWIAALLLCGIIFAGALKQFPPFSSLMSLNNQLKNSWSAPRQQPPIPHAEILTVEELAQQTDLEVDTLLQNLASHNINAQSDDIFGDIATAYQMSPDQLYRIAINQETGTGQNRRRGQSGSSGGGTGAGGSGHGEGFGQKTLRQACSDLNIDIQLALDTLKQAGIECTADQRIRQIADQNNSHPSQIKQTLEALTN